MSRAGGLLVGLSLAAMALGAVGVQALSTARAEPPIDAALAARAEGIVLSRCGVCHSTDLISQQRLPRAKWEAIVAKMRHWGAQLSDDDAAALLAYVADRYAPTAPIVSVPPPAAASLPPNIPAVSDRPTGVARRGATLFATNCQACHGEKAVGGAGPKLSGNPILREGDRFWETVLHGRGAMPAWAALLKPQDIADIHAWLQTLSK